MNLIITIAILISIASNAIAFDTEDSLKNVMASPEFEEIKPGPCVKIELRYASEKNVFGQNFYGKFNKVFLHKVAAEKFKIAANYLCKNYPGHKFVVFDGLRPRSAQYKMWDYVVNTDRQKYVANPKTGSIHNYGFAIDLSVAGKNGALLDFGTDFDDFNPLAEPRRESEFLNSGRLTKAQVQNRRVLRKCMTAGGFIPLMIEWWHFDALSKEKVKSQYKIVE